MVAIFSNNDNVGVVGVSAIFVGYEKSVSHADCDRMQSWIRVPHSTLLERVGYVEELSLYASSVISRIACLSSSYSSFEDVPVKVKLKLRSSMHA